ncbi:CoxG family protein [Brucellaceae bacterium C25G]
MDLTGEERIAAPLEAVWNALNDIETLKACIPGCDNLERIDDSQIRAGIKVNLGIMKVGFHGILELSNMVPPHSYTISGKGEGTLAGFAEGAADVHLTKDGNETILSYEIQGDAGGKIAKIGTKILGSAARKIADRFFANIAQAATEQASSQA